MMMQNNNKIQEAVDLFWKQNGVRMEGNATICYSLPWEQKLYNKKKAEEILSKCTKDELIDYILYHGRLNYDTLQTSVSTKDYEVNEFQMQ